MAALLSGKAVKIQMMTRQVEGVHYTTRAELHLVCQACTANHKVLFTQVSNINNIASFYIYPTGLPFSKMFLKVCQLMVWIITYTAAFCNLSSSTKPFPASLNVTNTTPYHMQASLVLCALCPLENNNYSSITNSSHKLDPDLTRDLWLFTELSSLEGGSFYFKLLSCMQMLLKL